MKKRKIRKKNLYIGMFVFLGIALAIFFIYPKYNVLFGAVGKSSLELEVDNEYLPGENLSGLLKIWLQEGELIPENSKIVIDQNGAVSEFLLSEIIDANISGDFYMKSSGLKGKGKGYGFIGKKKVYPEINFVLKIKDKKEKEQKKEEKNETSTEKEKKNETSETSAEILITNETEEKDKEKESQITGAVILENEINGVVSKDNVFEYEIGDEEVEIVSVDKGTKDDLNLKIENGLLTIDTDYYEIEQGFGEEFLGEKGVIEIELSKLGVSVNAGQLVVSLVYENEKLLWANNEFIYVEEGKREEGIETGKEGNVSGEESEEIEQDFFEDNEKYRLDISEKIETLLISGNGEFESDDGFVRIILNDKNGNEYLVYETFAMIEGGDFIFENVCEETCILDSIELELLRIELSDASIEINNMSYSISSGGGLFGSFLSLITGNAIDGKVKLPEKAQKTKEAKDVVKTNKLNKKLEEKGERWRAKETDISKLSYSEKKELFYSEYGRLPNLKGYEYFDGLVSLDSARKVAEYYSKLRWKESKLGFAKLATNYDGRPEAYFFLIYKNDAKEITNEELEALASLTDELVLAESYGSVVIGANVEREPFLASFDGVPLQLIMREKIKEKRKIETGKEEEPRIIFAAPYFISFEFNKEYYTLDGVKINPKWKDEISEEILEQRKDKWKKWEI